MIFIRLLHLLAHHPDFQLTEEAIPDIAKYEMFSVQKSGPADKVCRYIDFYLDLICTSDNVGLLYHLATKAKTVRDAESYTHSEVGSQ